MEVLCVEKNTSKNEIRIFFSDNPEDHVSDLNGITLSTFESCNDAKAFVSLFVKEGNIDQAISIALKNKGEGNLKMEKRREYHA